MFFLGPAFAGPGFFIPLGFFRIDAFSLLFRDLRTARCQQDFHRDSFGAI